MNNIKLFEEKINSAQKIAIFGHDNPDGDAIWSMLWLWRLLEKLWKDISYFTPSTPSKVFNFLKWFDKIRDEFDYGYYNLLIFVDFSDYSRLWKIIKTKTDNNIEDKTHYFQENDIIVLDHHQWNSHPSNRTTLKDVDATSTCEIIFENTINILEKYYDSEIATYLYLWLTTDSGNFRYDQNHERILKNALELIKLWADKKLIIDNFINNKSMWTIKFLQVLLERLTQKWDILYTYYDIDELSKYDIDNEQAWYGLTIIQEIKWPKVIMTIRKSWNMIKGSLRSKDTNVEDIAKFFGGGWHIKAAGFAVPIQVNFETTKNEIINKINNLI